MVDDGVECPATAAAAGAAATAAATSRNDARLREIAFRIVRQVDLTEQFFRRYQSCCISESWVIQFSFL